MKTETTPFYKTPATASDIAVLMFVGLKLSHQIDWSWWWVLSPTWISLVLLVLIALVKGGRQ